MGSPRIALEAAGIVKRYAAVAALDDVSLTVAEGECVALVGESGSGKSTLLKVFNGLTVPDAGRVAVDGRDVAAWDPETLRRSIGYVPQDGGLLPHWTVARNVGLVPWLLGRASERDDTARALDAVGLSAQTFGDRWPHELSGGQRQRAAFARALAAGPRAMLLDEPFGALDALSRSDLQTMFLELRASRRLTTVLVTHDLHEAFLLADRIAVLCQGRCEQVGAPQALVARPATSYVAALLERSRVVPRGPQ